MLLFLHDQMACEENMTLQHIASKKADDWAFLHVVYSLMNVSKV